MENNYAQPRTDEGKYRKLSRKDKFVVSIKTIGVYTLIIIAVCGILYARMESGRADLEKKAIQVQLDAKQAEIEAQQNEIERLQGFTQ